MSTEGKHKYTSVKIPKRGRKKTSYELKEKRATIHFSSGSDYTDEQIKFIKAIDLYKRKKNLVFLDVASILIVLSNLGYKKVTLNGANGILPESELKDALENYKKTKKIPFPTYCDILSVVKTLGYC